jgi:hypothetical protein
MYTDMPLDHTWKFAEISHRATRVSAAGIRVVLRRGFKPAGALLERVRAEREGAGTMALMCRCHAITDGRRFGMLPL